MLTRGAPHGYRKAAVMCGWPAVAATAALGAVLGQPDVTTHRLWRYGEQRHLPNRDPKMTSMSPTTSYEPIAEETVDASLRRSAARVIPGGLWGHMNVARLPASYPQYFARARGCRLWDVDGNEYIDFMCTYGPMILGYGDEDVERAAARQREQADIANGPSPRLVELAELVVGTIPHADWVVFAKNGADATTTCVTLARAGTGRRKVLVARGSYHGAVPWCTPSLAGVTAEDRAHLIHFDYNDVAGLEAAVDEAGDDLAAILVTAFRHDVRRDQELASPALAQAARALCDRKVAALIIDDVRAGFRLHLGGSGARRSRTAVRSRR
jgi:glutamate-1-semialdehyde 2,1-aminomutase